MARSSKLFSFETTTKEKSNVVKEVWHVTPVLFASNLILAELVKKEKDQNNKTIVIDRQFVLVNIENFENWKKELSNVPNITYKMNALSTVMVTTDAGQYLYACKQYCEANNYLFEDLTI